MNKLVRKNKKGFTLTEMIVVIAIIGILAAVMIPSVVIYVNKARQNAAYQQAVAVLDFYDAFNTEKESGLIKIEAGTANFEDDGIYVDFADYYQTMTGKALNTGYEIDETDKTFTFVGDNGVKVVINMTDMSATYPKN